ncbi:MAG: flavin reductase family protein, partial [Nanoarchaeota archaeon]|nr:flavin reductase family protein [Nanoarchaeota archaeon]
MPELGHIPYPRQVILVTCHAEIEIMGKEIDKKNIITLSWHMPVSFKPSMYAISVGKERLSHDIIKKSGVFCVNFMPYELKDKVLFCGRHSGRTKDKFAESGLKEAKCDKIDCPR